jgi:hypothetical protein
LLDVFWSAAPLGAARTPSRSLDRLFSAHSSPLTDDRGKGATANPTRLDGAARHRRRGIMRLKLAAAALALLIATPAFAAEYYIVHGANSKKCSVVSKKPTSDKMTLVGDNAFKTKKEARTALKAADVCKA